MSTKTLCIALTLLAFTAPAFAGDAVVIWGQTAAPQTQGAGGQYPQVQYGDVKYTAPGAAQVQAQGGNYQQIQYVNGKPTFVPYTQYQQPVCNQQSQVFKVAPAPSQLYTYNYNFAFNSMTEYQQWQKQMNQYCQQNRVQVQVYHPRGVYTPPVQQYQQQYTQRYDHLNQYDAQYYAQQNQYQLEMQRLQYQREAQQQQIQFQREQYEYQRRQQEQQQRDQRNIAMASMFGQMIPMFVIAAQSNRGY